MGGSGAARSRARAHTTCEEHCCATRLSSCCLAPAQHPFPFVLLQLLPPTPPQQGNLQPLLLPAASNSLCLLTPAQVCNRGPGRLASCKLRAGEAGARTGTHTDRYTVSSPPHPSPASSQQKSAQVLQQQSTLTSLPLTPCLLRGTLCLSPTALKDYRAFCMVFSLMVCLFIVGGVCNEHTKSTELVVFHETCPKSLFPQKS